jgi:hypothetical protein
MGQNPERLTMSSKRGAAIAPDIRRILGPSWAPDPKDPDIASTTLAITVALLRALRDRGLLTVGEIDDLFGEAAERFQDTSAKSASALRLLDRVHADVEKKDEE